MRFFSVGFARWWSVEAVETRWTKSWQGRPPAALAELGPVVGLLYEEASDCDDDFHRFSGN